MSYRANRLVKTSVRTFAIVEQMSQTDHVRVSELATELETSKGIIHNHLSTLRELGYVRKVDDGYQLSPKLLQLGYQTRSNARLYTAAHDLLGEFSDRFETGVVLFEAAGSECVAVDAHTVSEATTFGVGTSVAVQSSLPGHVIYAQNGDADWIDSSHQYELSTISDAVDEQGYAVGPIASGIPLRCVASPIRNEADDCYGCFILIPPEGLSDQQTQRISEAAIRLRSRIENRLCSSWDETRSFATEKHSWIK